MHRCFVLIVGLAACGTVKNNPDIDAAAPPSDGPVTTDTPVDDGGCQPKTLLVGGTDVAAQGWSTVMQAPATVSYGPDYVHLATSSAGGGTSGGQLLLNYPGAFDANMPFKLEVVILVEQVNPHNSFDSAAAIMGSYSGGFGLGNDRSQMIYLDGNAIGWADDTQSFTTTITNNVFHTFVLSVDAPNGNANVTVDGIQALTRAGFVYNGSIAIGDQTNDLNVDSSLRIRSVKLLCP